MTLFENHNFRTESILSSTMRYARDYTKDYEDLLKRTDRTILEKYEVDISGGQVYVSVTVLNILFRKQSKDILKTV